MTRWLAGWSLGARLVVMFSGLLAAIGVFMLAYFPARMDEKARESARDHAATITRVMSTALGPALEFEDPDNAATILNWLATSREARFGVVISASGSELAAWHPEARPAWATGLAVTPGLEARGMMMVSTTPIEALGGGRGTLQLGFSLQKLAREHDATRGAVALVTIGVFVVGVLATMLLARLLIRPIRTLTSTARKIARGELPPELPAVAGAPEVARLTTALGEMLERIHAVSQAELLRASRHAGMAEVATGILHNVGNVLTSVNVSVDMLRERVTAMPVDRLRRLHALMSDAPTPTEPAVADMRMTALRYLQVVGDAFATSREESMRDLRALGGHVEHIKRVVAMQNANARMRSVKEPTKVAALVDEAIELGCRSRRAELDITVMIDEALETTIHIDRHRVQQILVNLISNARDAVTSAGTRSIAVRARLLPEQLELEVKDTGVGIPADALARIFNAGFTSKADGHGYGLHSSALAAKQMGGELTAKSTGGGDGATFTLTIPLESHP